MKKILSVLTIFLIATLNAYSAEWIVDNNASQLNFISIKKGNIAEVHQFKTLQGSLDSQGEFELNIDLSSVDTQNPIRDERMKIHLFNVESCTDATLKANIDLADLDAIAEGASSRLTVDAELELHGETQALTMNVIVTRLVGAKLSVTSAEPIILNVEDFALVSGVNKLMELAKLPSISHAVPVSFYLTFKLK